MSSPFGARRKARVMGQDEETSTPDTSMSGSDNIDQDVVFRRPSTKTKKRSSTRLSFGPGSTSMGDEEEETSVFTPKKSSLSRAAAERNAQRNLRKTASLASLSRAAQPSTPAAGESSRSYSKESLAELKNSTPNTPQRSPSPNNSKTLDIASISQTSLARPSYTGGTLIPSETEIAEKKARRARLAKEEKYKPKRGSGSESDDEDDGQDVSDNPHDRDSDDDEFRSHHDVISLNAGSRSRHKAEPASRLAAHDDEDLLDDSTLLGTPNRIQLGRAAEKEAAKKHRAQMAELISDAEKSSSESSSGDDFEGTNHDRREAYDAAQTRAGMAGLYLDSASRDAEREKRERKSGARTPPKITPLPTLSGCVEWLRTRERELDEGIKEKVRGLEEVGREREEIKGQEEHLQKMLDDLGKKWKEINGIKDGERDVMEGVVSQVGDRARLGATGSPRMGLGMGTGLGFRNSFGGGINGDERGLESLGGTPVKGTPLRQVNGFSDEG